MDGERDLVGSHRVLSLAEKFPDKRYRDGYIAAHTRGVLARQMRNFRGQLSQADYAAKIGKQKTVVSRLENPAYSGWSLRTMLEIAREENVAVLVRFVDFPTFLGFTDDISDESLHPHAYDQAEIDRFAAYQAGQISYYDIRLPLDINRATSMTGIGAVGGGTLTTGTTTLPLGAGVPLLPFQGAGNFIGGGAVWPMSHFVAAPPFAPQEVQVAPPTPSALRRAHAEIHRLDNLVQAQAALIANLKQLVGEPQEQLVGIAASKEPETTVANWRRAGNPVQSQAIPLRAA
jgi:hypothetical protein